MRVEACIIILLNALTSASFRGPHHPRGQIPVEHKHHHYKPRGSEPLTGDAQLLHDTKHIEEDSQVLTPEMLSKMTPEELEFHYFSAHDFDRNSKLDGLELLKITEMDVTEIIYRSVTMGGLIAKSDLFQATFGWRSPAEHLDTLLYLIAVYHTIEHEATDPDDDSSIEPEANDLEDYITLVDRTLDADDTDGDGYVSYAEYRAARAKNNFDRTPIVLASD